MSVQGNLQQDEQALEQDEASLKTTVAAQVSDIQAEIANLKDQIPDPTVLNALDSKLQQLHQSLTADTAAVAAADPGAPAPAPQPPSPTPTPAPPTPTPTPAPTPGPTQTVYVFDGDPSTVDPSQWRRIGYDTVDSPPRPLFYFLGDTAPGDVNGSNQPNWSMYSGSVQPSAT